eukprot:5077578-Amphidinium_carterae.2
MQEEYANTAGTELLSYEVCKHVTDEQWERGVNLVKGVLPQCRGFVLTSEVITKTSFGNQSRSDVVLRVLSLRLLDELLVL